VTESVNQNYIKKQQKKYSISIYICAVQIHRITSYNSSLRKLETVPDHSNFLKLKNTEKKRQ